MAQVKVLLWDEAHRTTIDWPGPSWAWVSCNGWRGWGNGRSASTRAVGGSTRRGAQGGGERTYGHEHMQGDQLGRRETQGYVSLRTMVITDTCRCPDAMARYDVRMRRKAEGDG